VQLKGWFTLHFGPSIEIKLLLEIRLYDQSGCLRSVGSEFQTRGLAALKACVVMELVTMVCQE